MSDAVLVALITAVPSTIAALVSGIALLRIGQVTRKVEEVRHATNSMKDELVAATQVAAESKGRDEERARSEEI